MKIPKKKMKNLKKNDMVLDKVLTEGKESLTQQIIKKHPKKYKDEKAVKSAAAKLMKSPKFKGKGIGPVLQALLKESADFGNDPQDRYDYVRPLMSRLPDTPRTEYLIDALEDALEDFKMTDDMTEKMEFDNIFIEIMKELGLENELREMNDPVTKMMKEPLGAPSGNPYAEEPTMTDEEFEAIFGKGTEAAGDYSDKMSATQKANVFVRENKALKASNDLEDAINSVASELTDAQIDTITDMILDLRDKVKTQLKKKKK